MGTRKPIDEGESRVGRRLRLEPPALREIEDLLATYEGQPTRIETDKWRDLTLDQLLALSDRTVRELEIASADDSVVLRITRVRWSISHGNDPQDAALASQVVRDTVG